MINKGSTTRDDVASGLMTWLRGRFLKSRQNKKLFKRWSLITNSLSISFHKTGQKKLAVKVTLMMIIGYFVVTDDLQALPSLKRGQNGVLSVEWSDSHIMSGEHCPTGPHTLSTQPLYRWFPTRQQNMVYNTNTHTRTLWPYTQGSNVIEQIINHELVLICFLSTYF